MTRIKELDNEHIGIRVSPALKRLLAEKATEKGIGISEYIRRLIIASLVEV